MRKVLVVGLAALALTGCSAADPKPDPAVSEQEVSDFPRTYRSVVDLRDAFIAAGGECPSWQQTNAVKAAAESGTCSDSNVLSIYTSESQKDVAIDLFKSLAPVDANLLAGENWIINDPSVKSLDPAIGGTFVTF